MIMKVLTMCIAVSLFLPVVFDKTLKEQHQWLLIFV